MIVVSRPIAAVIALGAIIALLYTAHRLVVTKESKPDQGTAAWRRRGVNALVIGTDGRASTSKVQAVLWTFAVFFALLFLLVWGRSAGCGETKHHDSSSCQGAASARDAFRTFTDHGLQPEYYVLLGIPLTVAVAAKAITSAKVADGTVEKPELSQQESGGRRVQTLREVVTNDHGETDLLDFQYFAFNLLTLAFFLVQFLTDPSAGLPNLPATLLALSGVSAAGYTTKKALEEDPPAHQPESTAEAGSTATEPKPAPKHP